MPASLERKLEGIQLLLHNLATEMSTGTPVVVEGIKDLRTLKKLEATGDIICAKTSGKNMLDVLREVEERGKPEVILLMDFDRHGREWTEFFARNLENMKIKPNLVFWKELLSLVGRDVKDIEGLSTYFQTLRRKIGKDIFDVEE